MTPSPVGEKRKSLDERLVKYGAMAVAAVAAASAPAKADIIIHYPGNENSTGLNSPLFFKMTADGASKNSTGADFQLWNSWSTSAGIPYYAAAGVIPLMWSRYFVVGVGPFSSLVARLGAGEEVGYPRAFATSSGTLADHYYGIGNWQALGQGYIGVSFPDAAGNTLYGWIDITIESDYRVTLTRWAYEDEGNPILTGAGPTVPEPSSLTLMALGASGLAILRRRRRQNQAG